MKTRAARYFLVALGVWTVATAGRIALRVPFGLNAEYFRVQALAGEPRVREAGAPGSSDDPSGRPVRRVVTHEISTARITADWGGMPPPAFRVRWYGYLTIPRAGSYTFATTSDDGSTVQIGGRMVVDNSGDHGPRSQTGVVDLERGTHFVLLEYFQSGGAYEMSWAWARADDRLSTVPAWALSPVRAAYWKVLLGWALDWISAVALGAWALIAGGLALAYVTPRIERFTTSAPVSTGSGATGARLASFMLFAALAIVHTWPLATDPGGLSRNDNGDTLLNEWALAWVAHQAPRAPLHLFQANIFYPEEYTLAYSETMIVQSAMGAPFRWLGASPVLTYNLVLFAGFVLTGWTMSLVVARWTGNAAAGLMAGILFGFNAHTLARLPHLQAHHVEFLPFALMALDRLLCEPRAGHAVRLAGWFTLQALTSVYLLVFSAFGLAAAALARPESWGGHRFKRVAPLVVLAAVVAALALLPFLLPYWRLYRDHGLSRSLAEIRQYSGSWQDYLSTPARFHYALWSHRFFTGNGLFPGVVGIGLSFMAIVRGVAFRDPRARMCLALGVCGVALSFGPRLPGYVTLYDLMPLLRAIRAPVRFGYLAIFATAVLAGFGLVELRRLLSPRLWTPLSGLLLVVAALEPLAAPLHLTPFKGIPGIYRQIRAEPHAVVVELPFPRAAFVNAPYMLNSTEHWKPMLNGYSGFLPASYRRNYEALRRFPDPASIGALQTLGVTHLFVHLNQFSPQIDEDLDRIPALRKVSTEGPIALYRLDVARPAQ